MAKLEQSFIDEVKARTSLSGLVGRRVKLIKKGREYSGLCPFHSEKTPSFTVNEDKSFYHCFGCGAHGSAVDWMMETEGWTFIEAIEQLADLAGMDIPVDRTTHKNEAAPKALAPIVDRIDVIEQTQEKEKMIAWARDIWGQAIACPVVDGYLKSRNIDVSRLPNGVPVTLRYHPHLKHTNSGLYLPAMIGAVQNGQGRITGVHRTYLNATRSGKAAVTPSKKMAGVVWGGAIRLCAAETRMGIAEGIETGLSVYQATGLPVWAAGSLGNMAAIELPPMVKDLVLCVDSDGDQSALEKTLAKAVSFHAARGRKVSVARPPAGMDFNDMLAGIDHDA